MSNPWYWASDKDGRFSGLFIWLCYAIIVVTWPVAALWGWLRGRG